MNNVFKYLFILKKQLIFWNSKSKFKSSINLLSIIITTLSLTFIILTLSVNNGFKNHIINKLLNIDGQVHIYQKYNSKTLDDNFFNDKYLHTEVHSVEALIKTSNYSDGIILNAFDSNGYNVIKLNDYIVDGTYSDGGLIIGSGLAQKLHVDSGDYAYIINFINDKDININNLQITGIFETNVPYYDDYSVYINKNHLENFINPEIHDNYFIINKIGNNVDIYKNNFDALLNDYYVDYWFDRHEDFLMWLFSYDAPINILLVFIFIISLINLISSTYIDLTIRKDENMILYILGFSLSDIKRLYIFKNIIISLLSTFLTIIFLYIFIYLNNYFSFITIPSEIYFTNKLPIEINKMHFVSFFIYIFLISQFSSFISFKKSLKDNKIIKVDLV